MTITDALNTLTALKAQLLAKGFREEEQAFEELTITIERVTLRRGTRSMKIPLQVVDRVKP